MVCKRVQTVSCFFAHKKKNNNNLNLSRFLWKLMTRAWWPCRWQPAVKSSPTQWCLSIKPVPCLPCPPLNTTGSHWTVRFGFILHYVLLLNSFGYVLFCFFIILYWLFSAKQCNEIIACNLNSCYFMRNEYVMFNLCFAYVCLKTLWVADGRYFFKLCFKWLAGA